MNALVDSGSLDSCFTEVDTGGLLPCFLASLRDPGIDAFVVLGPDVNCKSNRGRSLRTMHPWSMHRAARAIANCEDVGGHDLQSAPLVSWVALDDSTCRSGNWALWRKQGYKSMLMVRIPITFGRHFECIFFCRHNEHSDDTAASIAYQTLTIWPKIKFEFSCRSGILNPPEQLALQLTAFGLTSQQIAERNNSNERMVNFHIGNAMRKLNATSRTGAVLKAILLGIL